MSNGFVRPSTSPWGAPVLFVCSQGQKTTEQKTSAEGLILKKLPSHLKYAFLEPEKRKLVIISA